MRHQEGLGLIEVLISLAVIGIVSTAFFAALGGASRAQALAERQEKGRNLAETEMEYVMSLPFNATSNNNSTSTYVPFAAPSYYSGYSVNVTTVLLEDWAVPTGRQEITVAVRQTGVTSPIATLKGYKTRR